jgi:mono/diheme cytochrome c family protein
MGFLHAAAGALLVGALGVGGSISTVQPAAAVFTAVQATEGRTTYQAHCASCHAGDLGGRDDAPALTGDGFLATWGGRTTTELFDFVRTTMPPDGASLTPEQYLTIVAHVLQQNGASAGEQPLTPTTAVRIGAVTGKAKPILLQ